MPPLSPVAGMQQHRRFMSGSFTDSHALAESGGLDAVAEERECSLSAVSVMMLCSSRPP